MDRSERERRIRDHLDAIRQLEGRDASTSPATDWPPDRFYALWHVIVGATVGAIGAGFSLAANIAGASLLGVNPMRLIRVYLTFPMGQRALEADSGLVLTIGSILYLLTGAIYGVAFHLILRLLLPQASLAKKVAVAIGFGIAIWIVNHYLILSWLQPALLGDNWIVRLIPVWIGAATHIGFALAMLVAEGMFGLGSPFRETAR